MYDKRRPKYYFVMKKVSSDPPIIEIVSAHTTRGAAEEALFLEDKACWTSKMKFEFEPGLQFILK